MGHDDKHAATHAAGAADTIAAALDARAIALTTRGDIVYRAAAANTLARLAAGAAGQALLSGGPAADPYWGAAAPVGHEATHVLAGADAIDSALDARAIALANRGDIPYRAAAANTLAALAPGVAGQALLSGGPAADPYWGVEPAPGAHEATHVLGGADAIDSALDARAIALTTHGDIVYRAAAANTLARLAPGLAGQALLSGGPAADPYWGVEPAPGAHASSHQSGGADETKDMELDNAPGVDDTGSGLLTVGTVGESVTAGQVLYLKADGKYWKALATGTATMPGKVLAMAGIAADATGKLLHIGYFRHDDWDFTVGNGIANILYVDKTTRGLVTQTAPAAAGDQVQVIGYCVTADIIFFNPCLELVEIS